MASTRDRIDRHMSFQRTEWRVQQIGRWGIGLFLVAALAGVFGDGPAASARVVSGGARFEVRYDRLIRRGAATRWTVQADVPAGQREVTIHFDSVFVDHFLIQHVWPEPARVEGATAGLVYIFASPRGADRLSATFDLEPQSAGFNSMTVTIDGHAVRMSSLTYF